VHDGALELRPQQRITAAGVVGLVGREGMLRRMLRLGAGGTIVAALAGAAWYARRRWNA
jgi:hypothetical protein